MMLRCVLSFMGFIFTYFGKLNEFSDVICLYGVEWSYGVYSILGWLVQKSKWFLCDVICVWILIIPCSWTSVKFVGIRKNFSTFRSLHCASIFSDIDVYLCLQKNRHFRTQAVVCCYLWHTIFLTPQKIQCRKWFVYKFTFYEIFSDRLVFS